MSSPHPRQTGSGVSRALHHRRAPPRNGRYLAVSGAAAAATGRTMLTPPHVSHQVSALRLHLH
eukprot:3257652-Prorocentrum_lima.AAC.1